MKTAKWLLIAVTTLSFLLPRDLLATGACTSARFHDWRDLGCNQNCSSAGTPAKSGCPPCNGMPRWWVSEPYINLCMMDTPLSYIMSSGKQMDFTFYYHQRSSTPGSDEMSDIPSTFTDTTCGTNASWGNNWTTSITIWDPTWESAWTYIPGSGPGGITGYWYPPNYPPYSGGYRALVSQPQGGLTYFNVPAGGQNNVDPASLARLTSVVSGQNYPAVETSDYYYTTNAPTSDANGVYWGDAGIGLELINPDGSQDVFGLSTGPIDDKPMPTPFNPSPAGFSAERLLLTQRIDPQGRVTRLGYIYDTNAVPYALVLGYVVDPDGRTNVFNYTTIIYNNGTYGALVSEIDDPYGRKATFAYNGSGLLTNSIDAARLTNSFQYQLPTVVTNWRINPITGVPYGPPYPAQPPYATLIPYYSGWITSLTTPYGTTSFNYYSVEDPTTTNGYSQRAIYVSEPEGAQQLYLYQHQNVGFVPALETSPTVAGQSNFDNGTTSGTSGHGAMTYRNTFHWGRRQFTALSGNYYFNEGISQSLDYQVSNPGFSQSEFASALSALGTNDYNKAEEKHWLLDGSDDFSITEGVSSERDPSQDPAGSIAGLRTWYNYPNKPSPELAGIGSVSTSNPLAPVCAAKILPDGSSQYSTYDFYAIGYYPGTPAGGGFVSDNETSYSKPDGTIGVLTNWFSYAANSVDLVSVSNSAGQYVNYGYNGSHQMTTATNALSQVTSLSWDPSTFNLTGVQLPAGKSITLSYNSQSIPPTLTSAMLQQISISPEGRSFTINNYSAGSPSSVTDDRGVNITNSWDGLNRLTSTTFPDSTTISNVYNRLDLVATKDRLNKWTQYAFDGLQHLTAVTNANNAVTFYSWCGCGSLNSILDALTNLTTLNYDNQGNLTNIVFSDASSITWQFDLADRITNAFDGIGRNLRLTYNNQGLPTSVASANGTLSQTVYDALNRPMIIRDANGVTVTNQFDAINELVARTWPDGIREGYGYNATGLIAYTNRDLHFTHYGRDGAGRLTSVTNANTEVTQVGYDSLDNVTVLIDGLLHQTTWQYNEYGWLTNKLDGLTRNAFRYGYNVNGWMTNRWTPEKGNTGYGYDNVGNLTNISYGAQTINYAYDALNRLTNMVDGVGTTAFSYTPSGHLHTESGPWTNDTLTCTYVQGLRTTLTLSQTTSNWSQSYGFDSGWRLQGVTSPAGSFGYTYNFEPASPLVTGITLPNGASIVNSYDSLARMTGTSLNNFWTHTLDGYTYKPDALGLRTNILRNLGLTSSTVTAGFDNIGQLTSWNAVEAGGTPRQNEQLGYAYDAAHNLHTRNNGSLAQTFTTDAANQLNSVTRTGTFTMSGAMAAPATNITVDGQAAQIYGDFTFAATNIVLTNGNNPFVIIAHNPYGVTTNNSFTNTFPSSVSLSFDHNGNLTNDGTMTFGYDSENQLTNVSVAGQWKLDFSYDGLNRRRISRSYYWNSGSWAKTNEVRYVYDGYVLIQERDANNNALVTYTRGSDLSGGFQAAGIAGMLARTDTNGSTFYHADGNGNISALMDASENIVARYLYGPFGKLLGQWGSMASVNEMQFSSMPHDSLSSLSLYPLRAYDPNLQRWPNQDPTGEPGGINLYSFVGNSPINHYDPLGLAIGDNWDPRTWFNSGFTESWSESSQSIWQALKADNPEDLADAYDNSALGQAESIGGGVYDAEKDLLGTAAVATAGVFGPNAAFAAALYSDDINHSGDKNGKNPCPDAIGAVHRVTNPKHNPNSNSPEPTNVNDLWNRSIQDKNGVRWAIDDDGVIHRFSKPSNDESHWNGSTDGPQPISRNNIPNDILKSLEEGGVGE